MEEYQILKNIEKHISLSDLEKAHFMDCVKIKAIDRKSLILRQGQICRNLFFVESGSLSAFNINDDFNCRSLPKWYQQQSRPYPKKYGQSGSSGASHISQRTYSYDRRVGCKSIN